MKNAWCMGKVTFDSRDVHEGDTFFALNGERVCGEDFLEDVARQGARVAVVSQDYVGPSYGLELERVEDVRYELQERARRRLEEWRPRVVGITGSVGKTTCKEYTATLLEEKFVVGKPKGSCNSQVSLPQTILNFKGNEEVLVLELGMSLKGEMARLVEIAQPEICVLTNVSLSHAGNFSGLEEIAREKMEIFNSKRIVQGFVSEQCPPCKWTRYGFGADCDVSFSIDGAPFTERHLLLNLMGAACVARALGLSDAQIEAGAKKLKNAPHRFERVKKGGALYVDDSYNASQISTISALEHLPEGRRVFVFGSMAELGKFSENAHRRVGEKAAEMVDMAILYGDECKPIEECLRKAGKSVWLFDSKEEVRKKMAEVIGSGDVVLVKGANSRKMWELIP